MLIPSMDTLDPTLVSLLDSLCKKNGLKSWNIHPEFSGSVCVKIRFNGQDGGSHTNGNKQNSVSKTKHNFKRAKKWKLNQADECEFKPTQQNYCEAEPMMNDKSSIDIPRNQQNVICKQDPVRDLFDSLSVINCTSNQAETSATTPHVNQAETKTHVVHSARSQTMLIESQMDDLSNETEHDPLQECLTSFDPFDNDRDSNYDENAPYMDPWPEFKRPCIIPGCFYFPKTELDESETNQQLGPRPNGTFKSYFKCDLCGRKLCDQCLWFKRRHLNHMKHVKRNGLSGPPDPVNIDNLMNGLF